MDQAWFEMAEVRRRSLQGAVWLPLLAIAKLEEVGTVGRLGYKEEFLGIGSVMIPVTQKAEADSMGWSDIGINHTPIGYAYDGIYTQAHVFQSGRSNVHGEYPVLKQHFNSLDPNEWHLNQDLVLTLGLKREGDNWLRPSEGYIEVARLKRTADGSPILLEIRSPHLRDYLCARKMGLYVTSFHSRMTIEASAKHISWPKGTKIDGTPHDQWEGRIMPIHEGGMRYGESIAVFHMSRTDVDPEEDAPSLGLPSDDNVTSRQWTERTKGKKLYRIIGELWKDEWIDPANSSPLVLGDEVAPTIFFTTSPAGDKESADTLVYGDGRWLWFKPEVVMALLSYRGSALGWFTRQTGQVSCAPDGGVHFGINSIGLVNVYAKDVGRLPEWQQRIWSGYNLSPDGKVSSELLDSQVKAVPAETHPPEPFLARGIERLSKLSKEKYGRSFIRPHEGLAELLPTIHRFRATDRAGLFALAKDLARVTADLLDIKAMNSVAPPPGERLGSLKSLELVLVQKIGADKARHIMVPLFKIYELRLADAHMSGSDLDEAMKELRIDQSSPPIYQGFQLVSECVSCLYRICAVIEE